MKVPRPVFTGGRVGIVLGCLMASLHAASIETPGHGTPLRKNVLDGLRATQMFTNLGKEFHSPIVFENVTLRVSGEWAWVVASPTWTDGKNKGEPVSCLMRNAGDKWVLVDQTGEKVALADNPETAFNKWRLKILKAHASVPPELIPTR